MIGALTATFLTAGVEWVEAYTIVLAVALTIGWRRALGAAGSALLVLAVLTFAFSFLLNRVANLAILQFLIGVFLVLFGLRWYAKAIARGAGLKPLHNEDIEFAHTQARAKISEPYAVWFIAFNGVLLEGLEVWLIVVALGVQMHHTLAACAAAFAALLTVIAAGALVRKPLSKIPENTIKFAVGSGILAFGTFWILESSGYAWPLADFSLLALFAFYAVSGWLLMRVYKTARA